MTPNEQLNLPHSPDELRRRTWQLTRLVCRFYQRSVPAESGVRPPGWAAIGPMSAGNVAASDVS